MPLYKAVVLFLLEKFTIMSVISNVKLIFTILYGNDLTGFNLHHVVFASIALGTPLRHLPCYNSKLGLHLLCQI